MKYDKIRKAINHAVKKGVFPGAVLLFSKDGEILFHEAFGLSDIYTGRKMKEESVFDLASLTKPLATAMAMAMLMDDGLLYPDTALGEILEDFQGTDKSAITMDQLMRHTSGLPAHRHYHKILVQSKHERKKILKKLLIKEALENPPGTRQVYSDLGYMLLSMAAEKKGEKRLDLFLSEKVYMPLGIKNLFFIEHWKDKNKRGGKSIVPTQACPWREKILKGEVDDDNAWALGGICGHAGLFGDASSVHTMCTEILRSLGGDANILPSGVLSSFVRTRDGFEMTAGFDTPAKQKSSAGTHMSKSAVGHLGFTGTSFWIDPVISLIIVLLTNRVHPLRSNEGIKEFRPKIHDLIVSGFL